MRELGRNIASRRDFVKVRATIKVEFTTREGMEKAYLIKKYFDPVVQKDIWDVLVFHEAELRTKLARKTATGKRYVESIITGAENE